MSSAKRDYAAVYKAATGKTVAAATVSGLEPLFAKLAAGNTLPPRGQQAVSAGLPAHALYDRRVNPSAYDYYHWVLANYFPDAKQSETSAQLIGMAFTSANVFQTDLPQPLTLNPWQIPAMQDWSIITTQAVVVENNGVFIQLHQEHPDWPLINQGGNDFQAAYVQLLQKLTARGLRLTYLGDLDATGIRIADTLLQKLPDVNAADFLAVQTPANVVRWVQQYGRADAQRTAKQTVVNPQLRMQMGTVALSGRYVEQEALLGEYAALVSAWLESRSQS